MMTQTELDKLWSDTLETMQQEVARSTFEAWLKNTRPIGVEDQTLVVAVPNRWVRGWLEGKLSDDLHRALHNAAHYKFTLRFVIDDRPVPPESDHPLLNGAMGELAATSQTTNRRPPMLRQPLNPKYTFDTFVIGSSNRLAHAASLAVAEAPARAYNPLFLYGGVGLGKTHLMQAIAHHVLQRNPATRVTYVSSETFTNEMINSIRDGSTVSFRNRYRANDILLVDDIQFLAGKESTQEEFFHTFNALHEANRQIVLSSDRPPKDIPTLEERLRSRFEWGLISDLQAPDLETRIAILRKKAQVEQLRIPDDVIYYIAERVTSNIRELEGALIRLIAHSSLTDTPIVLDTAMKTLEDLLPDVVAPNHATIPRIQEIVARHFSLDPNELKIRKRTRSVAFPRQVAMYLSRELTDASLPKIGEEFGGRDHTTVLHAHDKIRTMAQSDRQTQLLLEQLAVAVQQKP